MQAQNKKELLLAGIFLLILSAVFSLIYMPLYRQFNSLKAEHVETLNEIKGLYSFIGGKKDIHHKIIDMRNTVEEMEKTFPYETSVSGIIRQLNEKARYFDVSVISFKPRNLEIYRDAKDAEVKIGDSFCKCMPLSIETESDYKSLGKFLIDLKKSTSPMLIIESAKIEKSDNVPSGLRAGISLCAFMRGN